MDLSITFIQKRNQLKKCAILKLKHQTTNRNCESSPKPIAFYRNRKPVQEGVKMFHVFIPTWLLFPFFLNINVNSYKLLFCTILMEINFFMMVISEKFDFVGMLMNCVAFWQNDSIVICVVLVIATTCCAIRSTCRVFHAICRAHYHAERVPLHGIWIYQLGDALLLPCYRVNSVYIQLHIS